MTEIEFGPCCFCGAPIARQGADPCSVRVTTAQDRWQMWRVHAACFKAALATLADAPGLFDPAHF
jgi:hypothetical protein